MSHTMTSEVLIRFTRMTKSQGNHFAYCDAKELSLMKFVTDRA